MSGERLVPQLASNALPQKRYLINRRKKKGHRTTSLAAHSGFFAQPSPTLAGARLGPWEDRKAHLRRVAGDTIAIQTGWPNPDSAVDKHLALRPLRDNEDQMHLATQNPVQYPG